MKKAAKFVLPLLILVFTACGGAATTETPATPETPESQPEAGAEVGEAPASPLDVMTRSAEGTSIDVWTWDSPEFNASMEAYIYESAGVTTEGQSIPQADIRDRIVVSMLAGGVGMPDAFKLNNVDIPWLVDIGALMDLTDLVEPYMDLLPQIAWDMVTYQGRIWAIPANSPAGGMFYRYDILQEFGINPDDLTTWDKWLEAGQLVVEESGGDIAWFATPRDRLHHYTFIFETVRQQFGAEIIDHNNQVTVNSPEFLNALEMSRRIVDADISVDMDLWAAPWYQSMRDGTVAVYPSGTWFVQTLIAQAPDTLGKWYFTPFPALEEGGDRFPNLNSAAVFISSNSANVDGSFEWCKAWTLDRVGSLDIGLKELGISVVSNTALSDDFVNQPHEFFARDQVYWREATEAFIDTTYVPPFTVYRQEALNIWNRFFEMWWMREAPTEEILYQAEQELQSRLGL